jgi:hypothetical protein
MTRRFFTGEPPNAEYLARENQSPADLSDSASRTPQALADAMARAPIGEPKSAFDVRCTYDSRPLNGFDFNLTQIFEESTDTTITASFLVPVGYRAVPRKWRIVFVPATLYEVSEVTVFFTNNGADVPYNSVCIGNGTTDPLDTFYLAEESSPFGCRIVLTPPVVVLAGLVVQVYGNYLPVTNVALPFEVTNRKI